MQKYGDAFSKSSYYDQLLYNKQNTNYITKQLNVRDLTVSVSLYKSSPDSGLILEKYMLSSFCCRFIFLKTVDNNVL